MLAAVAGYITFGVAAVLATVMIGGWMRQRLAERKTKGGRRW